MLMVADIRLLHSLKRCAFGAWALAFESSQAVAE